MHIGIDLGGTKTEIIAINSNSDELYRKRIPSAQGNYQDTLATIASLINETEKELNIQSSIGIGIPGAICPNTGKIKNANSTWLIGHPLHSDLEQLLGREIAISNDADCFVLSEAIDGAAQNFSNVFGIILGTGVGGGWVINKTLISGPNAISGEWGHNSLPWPSETDNPRSCYCGKKGCIETYLSGPGMLQHFSEFAPELAAETPQEIIELCRAGEETAINYFSHYLNRLGKALASVINIADPDAIVFGGGLSNVDEIYSVISDHTLPYVFSDTLNTQFLKAQHGDSSGVRGAAWIGANFE